MLELSANFLGDRFSTNARASLSFFFGLNLVVRMLCSKRGLDGAQASKKSTTTGFCSAMTRHCSWLFAVACSVRCCTSPLCFPAFLTHSTSPDTYLTAVVRRGTPQKRLRLNLPDPFLTSLPSRQLWRLPASTGKARPLISLLIGATIGATSTRVRRGWGCMTPPWYNGGILPAGGLTPHSTTQPHTLPYGDARPRCPLQWCIPLHSPTRSTPLPKTPEPRRTSMSLGERPARDFWRADCFPLL